MPISNLDEYDKVVNVSWFTPEKPREELTCVYPSIIRLNAVLTCSRFPCVLPFSQMYPLCCIDIRNFLNQFYFFSDDHFQHPNVIDETLKKVPITKTTDLTLSLIRNTVARPTPLRKSLPIPCGAPVVPISRTDSPNPHQPRALRNRLQRARTTANRCSLLHLSRRSNRAERHRRIPE